MDIVIRVDASSLIGSGHVMRCLALAESLKSAGASVSFICRELPGNLCDQITSKGYVVHRLPRPSQPISTWLGEEPQVELQQCQQLLRTLERPDWLIVDHYSLDATWERAMRPWVGKIFVIDDLANRAHDCEILLDQNYYEAAEERYSGRVPEACLMLLGPKFALLRSEFAAARARRVPKSGKARQILAFFGAGDPTGETRKLLDAISHLGEDGADLSFEVIVGHANPLSREIEKMAEKCPQVQIGHFGPGFLKKMEQADLFIGAGGTTTWERCCLGLPSLVISVADNQVKASQDLARAGKILYLGESRSVSVGDLTRGILMLGGNPWLLSHLSQASSRLVDGRGVERVHRYLMPPGLVLRPAEPRDCDAVFAWRNAEETRKYFFDPRAISLKEHREWFEKVLRDSQRALLIAENAEGPLGVLRYDFEGTQSVASIYLVPGIQGKGWGTQLLMAGSAWVRANRPAIQKIRAEVKVENRASMEAFLNAGFCRSMESLELVLRR